MKINIIVFLLLISQLAVAQKYVISGFVEDANTGERLLGAMVYDAKTYKGTQTNEYGFFSLTLPEGEVKLVVGFVGFVSFEKTLQLKADVDLNVQLTSDNAIEEVLITENKMGNTVENTRMSVQVLDVKKVKQLPVLLGEADIMKTIQLMPGVSGGTEGASGVYVRGGAPDQNLILLDGVPVYNANHLFGFFSVFNADAIQSATVYKGGFPARFGGRLSSVIDLRMKEGNRNQFRAEGAVSIIASRLMLEGPLFNDNTSFMISGRRTYLDLLIRPFLKAQLDGGKAGYFFYDTNFKINHKISNKSKIYLSVYNGLDEFYSKYDYSSFYDYNSREELDMSLGWGNITTALRWNYLFSNQLFMNATATYSKYNFDVGIESYYEYDTDYEQYNLEYLSGIEDYGFKLDFDYYPSASHNLKFGVGNTYHTFSPGVNAVKYDASYNEDVFSQKVGNRDRYANEIDIYAEDDIEINSQFKVNAGLHFSTFFISKQLYTSLQPRLAVRYKLNSDWSLKTSYAKMDQYILLLSNTGIGLPTDLWMPVTEKIPPMLSHQIAGGLIHNLGKQYALTIEAFYKQMKNVIRYKPGQSYFNMNDETGWEDLVNVGTGEAYGAEFLLEKNIGKLSGWLGYTLSWNWRQFDEVNFGNRFPYRYDRRHDIGLALTYKMSDRIDFGAVWVYNTGAAMTVATQKYGELGVDGYYYPNGYANVEFYGETNGLRMSDYHRFDVNFNIKKQKRWGTAIWSVGAYNVYNRKNPFFIYQSLYSERSRFYQVSILPLIPNISYSFVIENFKQTPK